MKIDESCINHNALRIVDDIVGEPFEWVDISDTDNISACVLGEVKGVLRMAEALKEVLKV